MSTPAKKIPALSVKEIAKIRALRKQGKSFKAIAKTIGRSDKTVAAFVKQDCPDCTPSDKAKCKTPCNEKKCADKSKKTTAKPTLKKVLLKKVVLVSPKKKAAEKPETKKSLPKPTPKKGVPGVDFVKIPITDEQRKSLIVGFKLLEVADSIGRVLAEAFKGL